VDDGWWLRADDDGVVRRANSVFAAGPCMGALAGGIARAEAWYAERGRPPRFQLSPASAPIGLAAALRRAGYRFETLVRVLVRDVSPEDGARARDGVRLADQADPGWLRAYASVLPAHEVGARTRLATVAPAPRAFAGVGGAACGLAVLDGDVVGLFDVATDPLERGRGHAGRITAALLGWAAEAGARRAYLQVAETNLSARALYARLGFRPLYRYRYAVRLEGPARASAPERPAADQ
jgi:N-acetylglutamate synthase